MYYKRLLAHLFLICILSAHHLPFVHALFDLDPHRFFHVLLMKMVVEFHHTLRRFSVVFLVRPDLIDDFRMELFKMPYFLRRQFREQVANIFVLRFPFHGSFDIVVRIMQLVLYLVHQAHDYFHAIT